MIVGHLIPIGLHTKQFCVQLMKACGVKTSCNQLVIDSVLCMLKTNLHLINNVAIYIDVSNIRHCTTITYCLYSILSANTKY